MNGLYTANYHHAFRVWQWDRREKQMISPHMLLMSRLAFMIYNLVCINITPHISPSIPHHTRDTVTHLAYLFAVYQPNAVARRCIRVDRRTLDAKKVGAYTVDSVACLETGQKGRIIITCVCKVRIPWWRATWLWLERREWGRRDGPQRQRWREFGTARERGCRVMCGSWFDGLNRFREANKDRVHMQMLRAWL